MSYFLVCLWQLACWVQITVTPISTAVSYWCGAGGLLTYNPSKRLSASQALEHRLFDRVRTNDIPLPTAVLSLYRQGRWEDKEMA
jgi:hypothetical protein